MNGDTPILKLALFVVNWSKIKIISSIFSQTNVKYHFVSKGRGTASSEVLDMLGIGAAEKAVILCLEQDIMVPALMREVGAKLGLNNPGTGIGFSIPLSAINNPVLTSLKENIEKNYSSLTESFPEKDRRKMDTKFDLIIAILNQGYSEEFMTVARGAGAGGGTVLSARGLMSTGQVKLFGISVQDEKEIVLILSRNDRKLPIMEAVSKSHGLGSKAEGIVFSVPADNITGIDLR
jgi:hypothetical protein